MRKRLIEKLLNMLYYKDEHGQYQQNPDREMYALASLITYKENVTWEENEWILRVIGRTKGDETLWSEEEYYYNWENEWSNRHHPNNPKRKKFKHDKYGKR